MTALKLHTCKPKADILNVGFKWIILQQMMIVTSEAFEDTVSTEECRRKINEMLTKAAFHRLLLVPINFVPVVLFSKWPFC
jgi:hypothetical protein